MFGLSLIWTESSKRTRAASSFKRDGKMSRSKRWAKSRDSSVHHLGFFISHLGRRKSGLKTVSERIAKPILWLTTGVRRATQSQNAQ